MRIGILEDDARDRDIMERLVGHWADAQDAPVRSEAYADAPSFLAACDKLPFDVALLDCYLDVHSPSDLTGLDVARAVRAQSAACAIVFTTSSRDFAVEGYEVAAAGYLMKPVEYDKLATLLDAAAQGAKAGEARPALTVQTKDGAVSLDPSLIRWCRSQGHYLDLHIRRGHALRSRMTFSELIAALKGDERFYACARGFLVNLDEVAGIEDLDFLLRNGERVPISKAKLTEARNIYANRVFARMRA